MNAFFFAIGFIDDTVHLLYKLMYIFRMFHHKVYFIRILWCETLKMGVMH